MFNSAPVQALGAQHWLFAYGGVLLSLLVLDALWIGLYMASAYKAALGELMLAQPRFAAAAVFYLLYAAGVVFLAVAPGLRADSWQTAALHGAVLGLIAYATYDATNYAILKAWPLGLSVVDVAWGSLMTALAAGGGWFVAQRWG
ncbi:MULTISPECIES: DUF2177 family protein [unclassified Duganella]|jgi:uncharacterized membrane protein|uniref:DUF2177 family protein n=1 Tax=unclassified Duganella TaxID=2636909 RepID=UPI000883C6E4|nr:MULTISPECIES: DUF2177 family protein [unclassified Duganella]SDF74532.1 Uncharacterized membrane protein [Duganella sp. OV458]SDI54955.1 Uncharacterized membrane protein [Duganella sp. OV510]